MAYSLRTMIINLRHKGCISKVDYQDLIMKLEEHDKQIMADAIEECKSIVMQTLDNEMLVDTLLLRMEQLKEQK